MKNDTLPIENILLKCLNMNEGGKMKNDTLPNKDMLVKCTNMSESGNMKMLHSHSCGVAKLIT